LGATTHVVVKELAQSRLSMVIDDEDGVNHDAFLL
jgi:hypothetical protein